MAQLTLNSATETPRGEAARRRPKPSGRLASMRAATRSETTLTFAAALVLNLLALALPLSVLQIYDAVIANAALETLVALSMGLIAIVAIEAALRAAQNQVLLIGAQRAGHRRYMEAIDLELGSAQLAQEGMSAERRMEKHRALDALVSYLSGDPRRHLVDLPFALIFLGALALIGGWIVLAPIGVAVIAAIIGAALRARVREASREREASAARSADFVAEVLRATATVKAIGAEAALCRRRERLSTAAGLRFWQTSVAASDVQSAIGALTAVGSVATVCFGAALVMDGVLSVGALAACSMLSARALQPILRGMAALAERQSAIVSAEAAGDLFTPGGRRFTPQARRVDAGPAAPELIAATLLHEDRVVFEEASLAPPPGRLTVIAADHAPDGAQMMRAIAGLAPLHAGDAVIDGLQAAEARGALGEIALITPEAGLFRGTIIENLTLFGAGASVDDAIAAARSLGLDETITSLPAGYETRVGESAHELLAEADLSRLRLAGALAQRPRLLLLDDPLYGLGVDDRPRLLKALRKLRGETTVIARPRGRELNALADARIALGGGFATLRRVRRAAAATGSKP